VTKVSRQARAAPVVQPDTQRLHYLDFELEIGPGVGREYPVVVVRSPAGEARETMTFPFDEVALESRLDKLQIALLRSSGRYRAILSPEERIVQDFGRELFDALFTGAVWDRYSVSLDKARRERSGLRLKLRIQPPELATLPWEFLYDARQLEHIAGSRLPEGYRRKLRGYRYGPGVFKMDLALDGPIPWRATECTQAGTVHVGGTLEEIAAAERAVWKGEHPEKPFVLLAQQSLFDSTRAPEGRHTVWAYCHVPNGSTFDMSERIESQIERFAPGFRDRILACSVRTAADVEDYNPNCVGGDINGGVQDIRQLFTRPVARINPYSTPTKGVYICSSSTPPGGGVHGMCGYHAAHAALRDLR
jgi:hypothetical protein